MATSGLTDKSIGDETVLKLAKSISSNLLRAQREDRRGNENMEARNRFLIKASSDSFCLGDILNNYGNYETRVVYSYH